MKVLVGMSGGVDSSVAALLLKKQGYEVIGATMVLFDDDKLKEGCLSSNAIKDAQMVCNKLGIKHHVIDLKIAFKKYVIDDFINAYKNGVTPNPCVCCNKYLKFGVLFKEAQKLGCDYVATGHYAKIKDGKLMVSTVKNKDQSYFLYGVDKNVLKHVIFPLDGFTSKEEIRRIAEENNLVVARKKDSQEICFIPDNDYVQFLRSKANLRSKEGNFVDKNGNVLGKHKGIINYTIGQRKGLGISSSHPLYVIKIDISNNEITLGSENDLYNNELECRNVNVLVDKLPSVVMAKIRFRASASLARLKTLENGNIKVIFKEPQRAITKGQSVVFYDKEGVVLGGGIII